MSLTADVHLTQPVNEHKGIHVMGRSRRWSCRPDFFAGRKSVLI